MKVFICANLFKDKTKAIFPKVVKALKSYKITPFAEKKYEAVCFDIKVDGISFGEADKNAEVCDIFLTIGGDGTILRWGKKAALFNKPLLGVNTGRLGFMATLEQDSLSKLGSLVDGKYKLSTRMMLDVAINTEKGTRSFKALNDVVLFKATTSKLPEYRVISGNTEVEKVRADGLIISTPTGSTAYSLSAGGPIIDPKISCFEVTALSPHTLFNRPMLLSVDEPLKASYAAYENSEVFVSVDGSEPMQLFPKDTISIGRSKLELKLIDIDGASFYSSVHNKLMKPLK
ncbi:MAG: NAD(+)/NADH kinase [Ruminococcaceae bacterium]|nr:NAD(+)/NADH kinase [Oscillospiraceae bacterium]